MLAGIKTDLQKAVKKGVSAYDIEDLACKLIKKTGGEPSFKKVPGYSWATCVNVNDQVVHGIPKKTTIIKKGDVVSVDVGLFYKGFHTDTSFSVGVEAADDVNRFVKAGERAVAKAIKQCLAGNYIYDLSKAMESVIVGEGYSPVTSLVGHGVGKNLHEEPQIPCFTYGKREETQQLKEGLVLAIEVMYGQGSGEVVKEEDGWTISTADGKISGLVEETVAIEADGPFVLTTTNHSATESD